MNIFEQITFIIFAKAYRSQTRQEEQELYNQYDFSYQAIGVR